MQNLDLDRERKRRIFQAGNLLMIPVLVFLVVFNYNRGATRDLVIDLAVFGFFLTSLYLIGKFSIDKMLYRIWFSVLILITLEGVTRGSGNGSELYWILIWPVALFYFFEKREGLVWVLTLFALMVLLIEFPQATGQVLYDIYHQAGFTLAYFILTATGYVIEANRSQYYHLLNQERNNLIRETELLKEAMGKIKTLSGLLPICSHCHKIRDDKGYWQRVESYLQDHSDAVFSHGICPECAEKYYENDISVQLAGDLEESRGI